MREREMAHPHRKEAADRAAAKLNKLANRARKIVTNSGGLVEGPLKGKSHKKEHIQGEGTVPKHRADRAMWRSKGGHVRKRADGGPLISDDNSPDNLMLTGAEGAAQPIPDQTLPPLPSGPQTIPQKLFGVNGPRYQLWPERMLRSALTLPGDVYSGKTPSTNPDTGDISDEVIQRSQDMAGLAGEAGLPMSGAGALGMAGGKLHAPDVRPRISVPHEDGSGILITRGPANPVNPKNYSGVLVPKDADVIPRRLYSQALADYRGLELAKKGVNNSEDLSSIARHQARLMNDVIVPFQEGNTTTNAP